MRPTHGDAIHLVEEILDGGVDLGLVTMPIDHPELVIEQLRQERLVACLRKDSQLAQRPALLPSDLQNHLSILYHPKRHPEWHTHLLELLHAAGLRIERYSRASHPSEMQTLVRDGIGVALIREGTPLDDQLTTRPIAGTNWTVDTAMIYHRQRHPKTVPMLVKAFKRKYGKGRGGHPAAQNTLGVQAIGGNAGKSRKTPDDGPVQMKLLG